MSPDEPNWDKLAEKARDVHPQCVIPWGIHEGEFECAFCKQTITQAAVYACPDAQRNLFPVYLCLDTEACDLKAAVSDEEASPS